MPYREGKENLENHPDKRKRRVLRALTSKKKEELRNQVYERDGTKCHYCGVERRDFIKVWGELFCGAGKRGQKPEEDRRDSSQEYDIANCVLACALCNMAKGDRLRCDEFQRVRNAIREIWQERKSGISKKHCYG